ncbi:DUF746 domain-containing protein [Ralstonia sp. 25C]|uniref:DUF746 domain-containing protein n=1 Tax=Ralstonia sp. 25C TaxID=3447363 RepID=UPI003F750F76
MRAVMMHGVRAKQAVSGTEGETLQAFLQRHLDRLMSPDSDPVPPCPQCHGTHIRKDGYARSQVAGGCLPNFKCVGCGHVYSRLSGTPFSKRRQRKQIDAWIALLGEELGCAEAARRLGVRNPTVYATVRLFRRWLLELDPSGHYEQCVRLGGRMTAVHVASPAGDGEGVTVREDLELSATLLADFDALYSRLPLPIPDCPGCGSGDVNAKGSHRGMPRFLCKNCGKQFNRRTGTPFARDRKLSEQRALVRYLGLPLPITQLADILQVDKADPARYLRKFRARCNQIDPSGTLSRRIRAGVRPSEKTLCVRCGAHRVLFDAVALGKCGNCGWIVSMRRDLVERGGVLEVGLVRLVPFGEAPGLPDFK